MKKFLALFCAAAVLAFAGMAFAEAGHGGHVVPVTPDLKGYKVVTPSSVVVPGAIGVPTVSALEAKDVPESASYDITLGTHPVLLQGFVLSFDHAAGASGDITISGDVNSEIKFAWITTNANPNNLYRYDVAGKVIKNVNYDTHFSSAKVVLGKEVATPTGGGSSSGCNAGFAGLLLLAAAPLLYFRKK